jgi:putative flavoprotein involved in K+ transport
VKRDSRLRVTSGRGFHDANDQRVADLINRRTQDSPEAVVIGAGPAGLAVARQLDHQHGIKALVLDRAAAPAISWRTRYESFRLNTTGFLSHLPGQRIPLNAGRWPAKEDMVRYFDHYVQRRRLTAAGRGRT